MPSINSNTVAINTKMRANFKSELKAAFCTMTLSIVALTPLLALQFPQPATAKSLETESLFLNKSHLNWQQSPNGYAVTSSQLVVLKADGRAALMSCSFYQDKAGDKLSYGDIGGFRLEVGRWSKTNLSSHQITLNLKLIDADKQSKSFYEEAHNKPRQAIFTTQSWRQFADIKWLKDETSQQLLKIDGLKNQNQLDEMLKKAWIKASQTSKP